MNKEKKNHQYYTVLATFKAKPGKEAELKKILISIIEPTLKEQGCINYDLHQGKNAPHQFMFYENWASKEVHSKHLETPHIQTALAKIGDYLLEPVSITYWEAVKS